MNGCIETTFRGRPLTLLFSIDVMFDAIEKYGSAAELLQALGGETRDTYAAVVWATERMAREGELARREAGYEPRPMLEPGEFSLRRTPYEYVTLRSACSEAIGRAFRREEPDEDGGEEDEGLAELRAKKAADEPTGRR